jgi:hypothetical protein
MLRFLRVHVVAAALLSTAPACVSVRMAGFDNETGVVRFCGNTHADREDIANAARESCSTNMRLQVLRCMSEQMGTRALSAKYGTCCDFRCQPPN